MDNTEKTIDTAEIINQEITRKMDELEACLRDTKKRCECALDILADGQMPEDVTDYTTTREIPKLIAEIYALRMARTIASRKRKSK